MRPLRALIIYITTVFLGGALLAPWLHGLMQVLSPVFPDLAEAPFHRYVHRAFLFLALAGLWPLLRALGARKPQDFGLVKPAGQSGRLIAGLVLGFVSLAVVAALALAGGARTWPESFDAARLAGRLLGAVATAAVVATLEEVLFRGGIFGGLRRVLDWRVALLISSAIYALVHFFAPARHEGPVLWNSGLALLVPMFSGFTNIQQLFPGFFNLTLAGVLLALAYQRTGNLYFSIGLHAGWVFWLKSYGVFTNSVAEANVWLYGTRKMTDGWLACVVLIIALLLLMRAKFVSKASSP